MVNLSNDLNSSMIRDRAIENHFAGSSWYEHTNQIFNHLIAAKLQILWKEVSSLDLSSTSVEGLQGLKVMVLRWIHSYFFKDRYLSLPQSMESLSNLRTLCLYGWTLGDISFVVRLTRLEILDLNSCVIDKLPYGIANLNKLKFLDLSKCAILDNCESVQLPQIEELLVSGAYVEMEDSKGEGRLMSCRMIYPSPSFADNIPTTNLQRYMIDFTTPPSFSSDEYMRKLCLPPMNISNISASMKNLLQRVEYVYFKGLQGYCQNIIPNVIRAVGGINDLAKLQLGFCSETECVLDNTSYPLDVNLPKLVQLDLTFMENLKEVCRGPPLLDFFERLQELNVVRCGKLQSIFPRESKLCNLKILHIKCLKIASLFSMSVAQSLAKLKELRIWDIKELKQIITKEEDRDGTNTGEQIIPLPMLKVLELKHLEDLHSICPEKYHLSCPSLKKLYVTRCQKLTKLCIMIGSEVVQLPSEHERCDLPNCQVLLAFNSGIGRCKEAFDSGIGRCKEDPRDEDFDYVLETAMDSDFFVEIVDDIRNDLRELASQSADSEDVAAKYVHQIMEEEDMWERICGSAVPE